MHRPGSQDLHSSDIDSLCCLETSQLTSLPQFPDLKKSGSGTYLALMGAEKIEDLAKCCVICVVYVLGVNCLSWFLKYISVNTLTT